MVALSLTAETESIDSEKWLFDYKLQEYKDCIPNLISRRQFNDRRKKRQASVRNYANIFELVERNICIFDAFVVFDDNSFILQFC